MRDAYLTGVLKAVGVSPKTVLEVGMGGNPHNLCVLIRNAPSIEKYTVVDWDSLPDAAAQEMDKLDDQQLGKFEHQAGDYLSREESPADLVLFDRVFGTCANMPLASIAKALVETKPNGGILLRENASYFRDSMNGEAVIPAYIPYLFMALKSYDVRLFKEQEDGLKETTVEEIMGIEEEAGINIVIKKPTRHSRKDDVNTALTLMSLAKEQGKSTLEKPRNFLNPRKSSLKIGWKSY